MNNAERMDRRQPWISGSIIGIYLLARLPGIMNIPLFNDELIYLSWVRGFPTTIASTLQDGKLIHPLLLGPLIQLTSASLLTGRLLSVISGLATLLLLPFVGRMLGFPQAGWLSALCYAVAPMAVLHERLFLADSLLTLAALLVLITSIQFTTNANPTTGHSLRIGLALGLSELVKVTGLFLAIIPISTTLFLTPTWPERWQRLALLRRAVIVALFSIALLAPFHYGGGMRGSAEAASLGERLTSIGENVRYAIDWMARYTAAPLLIPIGYALGLSQLALRTRRVISMLVCIAISFISIYILISTSLFSRYLFPALPPLLLAASIAISELWRTRRTLTRIVALGSLAAALLWGGWNAFLLATDPPAAPLAARDRWQYLEAWTAGYNLDAMMDRIRQEATTQGKIVLVNHARGRLIHMAAFYFLADRPNIQVERVELPETTATPEIEAFAKQAPTYLLLDGEEYDLLEMPQRFPKAHVIYFTQNPISAMRFYLLRYGS